LLDFFTQKKSLSKHGAGKTLGKKQPQGGRMIRFKKHLITGSLILGALAAPALGLADDTTAAAPAATPVATPTPLAWYQKLTVGGYLDEYYQVDFNRPADSFGSGEPMFRAFDTTSNQFTFGGGELTLSQSDASSNTGYFVDLLLGPLAGLYSVDGSSNGVEVGQAYVTQAFGNAKFTFGKFGTPVGYEVTYLPSDANFSRSLLFGQEPLFHVGAELAYTLPYSLVATVWADDGNSIDNAANAGKDYGAQLAYTGVKNLSLTGTWYLNNDQLVTYTGDPNGGELYDIEWGNLVATYQAMDNLSFGGEYLFKEYSLLGTYTFNAAGILPYNAIQQGYALYATYNTPIANLSISPRWEQWFNPTLGYDTTSPGGAFLGTFLGQNVTPVKLAELTLTAKYQMGPLAHMLEYRVDGASADNGGPYPFLTSNGNKPSFFSQFQQTLTYAAVYSF
jgi:hypothetical protein